MEQVKADNLQDRKFWRSGLAPLPVWRRKIKKHAKRKANVSVPTVDKRRKVEESLKELKENSPERRVRLVSDYDKDENKRNVVCLSDSNNEGDHEGDPESGFGLTLSIPELDSIETVKSQVVLQGT